MKRPTVDVCIPTYNQAQYLVEAVQSAIAQEFAPTRIIISDDCSTDDTASVMRHLAETSDLVNATSQAQRLGTCNNPRWVVSQGRSDYILKLDSDDRLRPAYIKRLVELLESNSKAGYAHAAVQEIDREGQPSKLRTLFRSTGYLGPEESLRMLASGYRVAANICLFRRSAIESTDFYRLDMPYAEDWDLAVRLADAGWGNCYCSEVLADYRVWGSSTRTVAARKIPEIRGVDIIFEKALRPAYQRRTWDTKPLDRARRRWVLANVGCLRDRSLTRTDRKELKNELLGFADSPLIRMQLWAVEAGLGSIVGLPRSLRQKAIGFAKEARRWVRRGG